MCWNIRPLKRKRGKGYGQPHPWRPSFWYFKAGRFEIEISLNVRAAAGDRWFVRIYCRHTSDVDTGLYNIEIGNHFKTRGRAKRWALRRVRDLVEQYKNTPRAVARTAARKLRGEHIVEWRHL